MAWRTILASSLRHRDFRLLMGSFICSAAGSWAYNVALAVWVFDETHSAGWLGAATIGRFVPALLFSAYGGVVAERFERVRLMVVLDVLSTCVMAVLVVETALHAPVALAIATAAVSSTIATMYEPAVAALTPQIVGERDLGSANALSNAIDNITVIGGPGLGALLLLVGPPPVAIAVNAVSYLASALLIVRMRTRSAPVDVTEGGDIGALQQMLVGVRAIADSPTAAILVAYSVVATLVFGVDTVQFVILSRDVLGTGAQGYGYLLAGLGVGGVVAAGVVTRLERLPRLGLVILAGMATYCLPTLLFLTVSSPVAAFFIESVRGAGTLVVDVLAMTALQRSLPNDVLARVFGAFNSLLLLAVVVGALAAPVVIHAAGLDASLWLAGAGIPIACLAGWPALRTMDRQGARRRASLAPRIQALSACRLFASVSEGALEQVAGAAEEIAVAAGKVVIREGDKADFFYIVLDGALAVTAQGEGGGEPTALSNMGAGDYFGEIGLIEQIPRTATVTTLHPTQLLRFEGGDFVAALTEAAPSPALLEGASTRLQRTHPSLQLTRSALRTDR
jgi:CRP-like cAMP-binding protein/predicted MFS family arabinose efflux permease